MAETRKDERFAVVFPHLNGYPPEEVRDKLARVFSILKSTASSIIQSAPIILLEDASPKEIDFLKKSLGVGLRIQPVAQLNGSLPRLAWPKRPVFRMEEIPVEEDASDYEFGEVGYVESDAGVRQVRFEEGGAAKSSTRTIAAKKAPETSEAGNIFEDAASEALFGNKTDSNDIFVYNIFLSKITSNGKRHRAAELISKIRSISAVEAEELMGRAIVPIMKGVTKKEADEIQKMFIENRIAVQVLKKAK